MARAQIEAEGMRETRRKFKEAGEGMADLKNTHKWIADSVAGTAKTLVPVKSGALQRSIRGSGTQASAIVRGGNNRKTGASAVPYGGPIHFGWAERGIRPQPFLYEAIDTRRQEVIDAYNQQVTQIIRRVF